MCIKPIKNFEDFLKAMNKASALADHIFTNSSLQTEHTSDSKEFDILATLIEEYEKNILLQASLDPIAIIKQFMNTKGLSINEFSLLVGTPEQAIDILEKRRPLTLPIVWNLCRFWKIPANCLLKPYKLGPKAQTNSYKPVLH